MMWFGAAGTILMLALFCGWIVLGYYQRELTVLKNELALHERAIPVLRAFQASDAIVCEERICIRADPQKARGAGKLQYQKAQPRPER